jgi:hypothetical protein
MMTGGTMEGLGAVMMVGARIMRIFMILSLRISAREQQYGGRHVGYGRLELAGVVLGYLELQSFWWTDCYYRGAVCKGGRYMAAG